jgi:coenzyme F420 hydrogenase subunit beta
MKPFNNVTEKIVPADVCVGCGLCEAVCPHTTLAMQVSQLGEFQPVVIDKCYDLCTLCMDICPFDAHDQDEDTLGLKRFGRLEGAQHDESLGYFLSTYVGHVADEAARAASASGGLASLFLKELLIRGEVDAVIVPQPTGDGNPWFEMSIVEDVEAIDQSRGSVYSPVHMGDVLHTVAWGPDRTYAIVALPCFAKAIRLAQESFPKLRRRLKHVLGLACGGMHSLQFADALVALSGGGAKQIDYRSKEGSRHAMDHRFVAHKEDATAASIRYQRLFGFLLLNNFAGLRACLFCDDVFAELADIVFMDAWLPEYKTDAKGTSLVICRNHHVDELLRQLQVDGLWHGGPIGADQVARSQRSVVAHKREPLPARIVVARESRFVPNKRCEKDPAPEPISASQKDSVQRKFTALDNGKEAFRVARGRWRNQSGLPLRIAAWRFCLTYYSILRAQRIPVLRAKTVFLLGWIPHPKAVLRRIRQSFRR